eukprot:3462574-Rhodomonas_salina.1
MSHCRKCWLVYSPRLVSIFDSSNVTFDDTLYPLKESDQCLYGYYDNAAITQMRANTYGPGILDTPLDDILLMPLPGDPISTDIDCNFDVLTYQELSSSNTSCVDFGDIHPAVIQSQHDFDNHMQRSVTEARGGKGSIVGDRGGHDFESLTEASWGNFQSSVGQKRSLSNIDSPSNGSLRLTAAHCDCFGKAILPLGQPIKNWWDC